MPCGYICGFPTGSNGDLYGGNVYMRSASAPSLQSQAQAEASRRWGEGPVGREVIAHPVCKGKFKPWRNGERQFGCFRHHAIRKRRIERAGTRDGWASFEQWSKPES